MIDRAFILVSWIQHFPSYHVHHFPWIGSDHYLIRLSTQSRSLIIVHSDLRRSSSYTWVTKILCEKFGGSHLRGCHVSADL